MLPAKSFSKVHMSEADCDNLSEIVTGHCGIKLGTAKKTMIQSRMDRRLIELGIQTYKEYLLFLKGSRGECELLINALTTNKTEFWRETEHFNKMVKIVKAEYSMRNSTRPMYFWSAACSAGKEAYTIAILMEEFKAKMGRFAYKVLGSDIDTEILKRAEHGIYPMSGLDGIPPQYKSKYFQRGVGQNQGLFKISDEILINTKFRQHNLIDPHENFSIKFDVIFLRNVLIYFDQQNIQIVIDKLTKHLNSGGYLFIGHSESLNGIKHKLKTISGSVYQKVNSGH